jgi:hypothetical protein
MLANGGDGVITFVLTDGTRFNLRPGWGAVLEQDMLGRFVRVLSYRAVLK